MTTGEGKHKHSCMSKTSDLEKRMREAKPGQIIEVKTSKERAEAHRIALRGDFGITTRSKLIGKGYEIVRH